MDRNQQELLQIFIVEDDAILCRLHRFSLEKMVANDIKVFENGKYAIDYLQNATSRRNKALVLLDLNMPVMNGWEFLESCRDTPFAENIHVVVVTSSPYKEDERKACQYEQVIGYYTKPLKREKILEILELKPELINLVNFNRSKKE